MVFDSGRLIFRIFMRFSWDVSGIVVVFDSGRPIFGIFMDFLWDFVGLLRCLLLVGPKLQNK